MTTGTVTPAVKAAVRKLGATRIMITNRGAIGSGKGVSAEMAANLIALGLAVPNGASRGVVNGASVRRLVPSAAGRKLIGA